MNRVDSQHTFVSRNHGASFCMRCHRRGTRHGANKRGRQERPENANSWLTCDPPGRPRGACRRGSNGVYDCIISSPPLPSLPPRHRLPPATSQRTTRLGAAAPRGPTHQTSLTRPPPEVPLSGDCWRKKENRSIHLPWA